MRTSNKILLTAFLFALFIVLGIYGAIYVNYKKSNFTSLESIERTQQFEVNNFKGVKYISLFGLQNCVLIPGDTLKLEIEKINNSQTYYHQAGDSLYISTDTILPGVHINSHLGRQRVKIYVPSNIEQIIAKECEMDLYGNEDPSKASSISFTLYDTWLKAGQAAELSAEISKAKNVMGSEYWNNIDLTAHDNSKFNISSRAHINELHASLWSSVLLDQGSSINKSTIHADKSSLVTLHGDNLSRIMTDSK